ncbi:MAG: PEP-utilizing enzyme [Mycobacteriaceae bacterium]
MRTTVGFDASSFAAPGPGSWVIDAVHNPRPVSTFQAEIYPPNLAAGLRSGARRYGLELDTVDLQLVNGFGYVQVQPAPIAQLSERGAAAAAAFDGKLWRDDVVRWERSAKPSSIRAHLALQAVDPATLARDELLAHLHRCREHQQRTIFQHHLFDCAALLPVGDFLAHAAEWTSLPLGEVLALIRGDAPESTGSCPELDRLVAEVRANPSALTQFDLGVDPAAVLAGIGAGADAVGAAARSYLDRVGYRLLDSLDPGDPYALEVPAVLVAGIRVAVDTGDSLSANVGDDELSRIRRQVPLADRGTFEDLLAEARFTSSLLDERGLYGEVWAGGITRRAILAAGSRLAGSGRIDAPVDLAEAGYTEIRTLLAGPGGPSAAELATRARYRATMHVADVPRSLGGPPGPPPPLDGGSSASARARHAINAASAALFGPWNTANDVTNEAGIVHGFGAGRGSYTGIARLIDAPAGYARLRRGDVLVTASTTEALNLVLPLLGAIVTDHGGLLSHAAIESRECGIPGVVGCGDATVHIADGARVRVDGNAGEVVVITP